jgi:hypothetical protein
MILQLYTGWPPLSELPGVNAMFQILNGERAQRPTGPPAMSDMLWQNITKYWAADPAARPSSQIVAQQMVWPAFEEGEDPLVSEEAVTPTMKINPCMCLSSLRCICSSKNNSNKGESSKVVHIDACTCPGIKTRSSFYISGNFRG